MKLMGVKQRSAATDLKIGAADRHTERVRRENRNVG